MSTTYTVTISVDTGAVELSGTEAEVVTALVAGGFSVELEPHPRYAFQVAPDYRDCWAPRFPSALNGEREAIRRMCAAAEVSEETTARMLEQGLPRTELW